MAIKIAENVRFKIIPIEMIDMFYAILNAAASQGTEPVITGASYENYPKGKVHDMGYAIDVRTSNLPDPKAFADQLIYDLSAVSRHYKVLYGDKKHLDHIHIGFAWYYSHDETRRRHYGG